MLGSVIQLWNLDPNRYKGHSFRIGAATYAAEQGVYEDKIRHSVDGNLMLSKSISEEPLESVHMWTCSCVRGCDVVTCWGGTTLQPHYWFDLNRLCRMQFCNIKYYVIPLPRMKFVLGWVCPCFARSLAVDCPHLRRQYMFNESFSLYLYWIFTF